VSPSFFGHPLGRPSFDQRHFKDTSRPGRKRKIRIKKDEDVLKSKCWGLGSAMVEAYERFRRS
jgi:hypothetical protein